MPEIHLQANVSDSIGCLPFSINFSALVSIPVDSSSWQFGDGNESTLNNLTYTYTIEGIYNAEFYAIDSNTCNIADSVNFTIIITDDIAIADIVVTETLYNCDSLLIDLHSNNIGTHSWDFGDGFTSNLQSVQHTYINQGIYDIIYILYDSSKACNPYDTATYILNFQELHSSIILQDTLACIPFSLDYNTNTIAQNYLWNFGNGDFSNTQSGIYIYNNEGNYNISLIVEDSTTCNILDTAFANIIAEDSRVVAEYDFTILNECDSLLSIQLDNQSINANTYQWFFDGTNMQTVEEVGNYSFNTIGTHSILLIVQNDSLCNPIDSTIHTFELLANVEAKFEVYDNCENTSIIIENNSTFANYFWNFGNGKTSNEQNPIFSYTQSGNYTILLTVVDSNTCNISNSYSEQVNIIDYAFANFITDSIKYLYPDDVYFTNLSENYTEFIWNFGDGETESEEEDPVHNYKILYNIIPCLSVWNEYCSDTICKNIFIDFQELIGVPNAFSPNEDEINDVIYVEGIGIASLNFTIFNRWGEKVFESDNQNIGWNGNYKGIKQEMEVYTYIVNAIFINEKSVRLKGNITLLR